MHWKSWVAPSVESSNWGLLFRGDTRAVVAKFTAHCNPFCDVRESIYGGRWASVGLTFGKHPWFQKQPDVMFIEPAKTAETTYQDPKFRP